MTSAARPWIVVVTWNGAQRLPDTLGGLGELEGEFDLVIVDNGSHDASAELAASLFPRACVIRNRENLGFAAASNQGIEYALARGASHVALVNDDMRLDRRWLAELLAESARDASLGVLGGAILFRDRPDTVNSTGLVHDRWWRVRDRHIGEPWSRHRGRPAEDVAGVSGGAMLLTRAALDRVGRLDATFFAYFEDVDFCLRARRCGFRIRFVPSALSWHGFAASTGVQSPLRARLLARNHMAIVGRYAPVAQVVPELIGVALVRSFGRAPLLVLRGRVAEASAEIQGSLAGVARGLRELVARASAGRGEDV